MEAKCDAGQVRPLGLWSGSGMADCISDIRQNDTGCEVHRQEKEASNGLKTHLNLGCKKDIVGNSNSIAVDNMPSSDVGNSIVSADMKIQAELDKEQSTVDDAEETNISVNTQNSLGSELHSSKADDDVDKGKADSLETSSSPTSKSVLPDHVEECVSAAAASNSSSIPESSDLPQSSSPCSPSRNTQQPSSPVINNQSGIQSDIDRDNSSALKPASSTDLLPKDLGVNHSSDIPGESEVKENQSENLCEINISSTNHVASENDNGLKDDGHQVEAFQEKSSVEIVPIDNNIEEDAKMDVESQDMTEEEKTVEKMPQSEECETNSPLEKNVSDQHDDGCSDEFSIKEGSVDNHDTSSCNKRNEAANTNLDVNMADAETEVGNANSQDSISGEGNDGESQVNLEEEADNAEMEFCDIKIAESISMAVDDSGEMTEDNIVMCEDETDKSNDKNTDNTETATNSNENDSCASSAQIQIEKTEGNTVDAVMNDNEEHSNDKTCEQNSAPAESEEEKNNVTDSVSPCDEVKSHTPSPQSAMENDAFCPEITNVESHEDKTFDCTSLDADKIVENHEVEETGQLEKCSQGEDGDKCSTSDLSLQQDKNISDAAQKVLTENDNLHAPDSVQSEVAGKPSSPIIKDEADIKTKVDSSSESSIIHKDMGKDVKSEGTEEKSSDPQDMKTGVSEGDEGADVDKNLEETKDEKKIRLNSQVDNESLDDKIVIDMKEDNDEDLDDEILFIDDDGKSKPLSEAPKLSFKNILKAPSIPSKVQNNDAKCTAEENKKKMTPESSHSTVGMKTITTLTHTKLIPDTRASVDSRDDTHEHKPGASTSKTQEEVKLENERKRSLSDKDDVPTTEAKRTKLDAMIDKLGDHLGKKPSEAAMEVLDSDDEAVLLDEQPNETIKDTQSTEEECKDKTAGKSEDDSSQKESKDEEPLQLTSQVLQSLIVAHIKAFAKKQRQSNIDKLNRRTRSMQSATNLWKDTAKHLEKTVLELTVLNQKLEKRKAHSNAVKQLASRTIGVQVGNDLKSSRSGSATANGPTNKKPEAPLHSSASLSLPPSVLLNPPPSQPQQPQQNARFMQQPTNRPAAPSPAQPHIHGPQIRGGRPPLRMQANNNVSPSQAVRQPGFANGRMVQQTNARIPTPSAPPKTVVNLIDLTDEEDIVKRTAPQAPRPAVTQPVSQHISKLGPAWKMSSSPSSGPTSQAQVPTASSGVVMGPNGQLIQTPASGGQTQIITQGNPPVGVPISQYQFVNIGNTAAQRPGTYLALVPGTRTPTANVAINPSQANMGASSQNSTPQSSTAAAKTTSYSLPPSFHISSKHPAPLPSGSDMGNAPPSAKKRPPKPGLKISRVSQGIVLSWNMPFLGDSEKISSYQLFAYQETETSIPKSNLWKKVGDVKALPLPMACTLTQFQEGNKYHFAVRAVDHYGRSGPYSDPSSIFLGPKT